MHSGKLIGSTILHFIPIIIGTSYHIMTKHASYIIKKSNQMTKAHSEKSTPHNDKSALHNDKSTPWYLMWILDTAVKAGVPYCIVKLLHLR